MENVSQMSLLEVAVKLMEQKRGIQNIHSLIKEVLEIKGLTDEDGTLTTKLYMDITTSSKFVYMGEGNWDLKSRQSLDEYDKDGSAFNSKDDLEEDDFDDDLDDDELEEDDDLDDDDSDSLDDEDDEEFDIDLEDDYDDDDYDEEDNLEEDGLDKIENDFDEDKYESLMDEYEDIYEN